MSEQMNINVNPDTLENISCAECNNMFYRQVVLAKKVSAIISPTGREEIVPLQEYVCDSCGFPLRFTVERGGDKDISDGIILGEK